LLLDQNFREFLFNGICVLMVIKFYTPFFVMIASFEVILLQRYPRSYVLLFLISRTDEKGNHQRGKNSRPTIRESHFSQSARPPAVKGTKNG